MKKLTDMNIFHWDWKGGWQDYRQSIFPFAKELAGPRWRLLTPDQKRDVADKGLAGQLAGYTFCFAASTFVIGITSEFLPVVVNAVNDSSPASFRLNDFWLNQITNVGLAGMITMSGFLALRMGAWRKQDAVERAFKNRRAYSW
jgi:hypothetical protein